MKQSEIKALVIDRDPTSGSHLRSQLERCGCEANLAREGRDGIEIALQHAPELVFLDVSTTGDVEVLAELDRLLSAAPIYALTEFSSDRIALLREARNRGLRFEVMTGAADEGTIASIVRMCRPFSDVPV